MFIKFYLVKICPIFVGSQLSCSARYQKVFWGCSFRCENPLNFDWHTMKFHNFHHIIAGCWVWMLYKKPTLQSKQDQQRICCDMWFLCNLLKNLYKTCFQNHLIKKNLEIHENKSHDWEIWRTIISDLGCFRRKGNLSKQATKNK